MEATGGKGPDLILETMGHVNLGKDVEMIAHHGTIAVIGSRGPATIMPTLLTHKEASIVGVLREFEGWRRSVCGEITSTPIEMGTPEQREAGFCYIDAGLADGTLKPVIGQVFKLADAVAAHQTIENPAKASAGKLVLVTE